MMLEENMFYDIQKLTEFTNQDFFIFQIVDEIGTVLHELMLINMGLCFQNETSYELVMKSEQ